MARCEQAEEYRLNITSADELKNIPLEFTNIANGKVMVYRDGKFVMEDQSGSGGSSSFINLTDTPNIYGGVGKFVAINSTNDGLEFVNAPTQDAYTAKFISTNDSVDLEPYKGFNRIIYQVEFGLGQEYTQVLPKISETEPTQIIILENRSSEDVTIQPNLQGEKIGGGTSATLFANFHMVLTPNATGNNWEVTFFGEEFQGALVKEDILNSIKGGNNVTIDRSQSGEITINATGGGTPAENTIDIEEDGVAKGTVKTLDFVGDDFLVGVSGDKVVIGIKPDDKDAKIPQIHEKYDFQVPLNRNGIAEKLNFDDIMVSTVQRDLPTKSVILPQGRYGICTNIKLDSRFTISGSYGVTLALYNEDTGLPIVGVDGRMLNQTFTVSALPNNLRLTGMFDVATDTKVNLRLTIPTLFPNDVYIAQNSGMVMSDISEQQGSSALHSFELEHNIVLTMNNYNFSQGVAFNETLDKLGNYSGGTSDYKMVGQFTSVSTSTDKIINITKDVTGLRAYGSPLGQIPIVEIANEIPDYYTGLLSNETVAISGELDNTQDAYTIHLLAYTGATPDNPKTIKSFLNDTWTYNDGYSLIKTIDVVRGASGTFNTTFTMPVCDRLMVVVTQLDVEEPINIKIKSLELSTPNDLDAYNVEIVPFTGTSTGGGVTEERVNEIVDTKIGAISVPTTEDITNLAEQAIGNAKVSDLKDVPVYDSAEEDSVLTKEGNNLVWKKPTGGGGGEGLTFTIEKHKLENTTASTIPYYHWKSYLSKLIPSPVIVTNYVTCKKWSNGVVEIFGTVALKYENWSNSSLKPYFFESLNMRINCGLAPTGFTYGTDAEDLYGTVRFDGGLFNTALKTGAGNQIRNTDDGILIFLSQQGVLPDGSVRSGYNGRDFVITFQATLIPTGA